MDTMKLLLGATIALLLGALVVSWQGMQQGVRNTPPDEIARLQKQIEELRLEQDRIQLEKQYQQLRSEPAAQPVQPSVSEMDVMKAQLAEKEAALQQIEAEKSKPSVMPMFTAMKPVSSASANWKKAMANSAVRG